MQSKGVGSPSKRQMLRSVRSPWQCRTLPASRRRSSSARIAQRRRVQLRGESGALRRRRRPRFGERAFVAEIEQRRHDGAAAAAPVDLGGLVEGGDARREPLDDRGGQRAGDGEAIEQRVLVEAAHLDDRIDQFALAVEDEPAIDGAGDPPRGDIERGRDASIERHFPLAHREPRLRRVEIEIGKDDIALELIGALRGQHDDRNMGDDRRARGCSASHEKADRLVLRAEAHSRCSLLSRSPTRSYPMRGGRGKATEDHGGAVG